MSVTSARHGRLRRSSTGSNLLKFLLTGIVVFALSGLSVAAYAAWGLTSSINTFSLGNGEGNADLPTVGAGSESLDGALTILLVGSDSRAGSILDDGETGELNDVNLLLHISEDHQNATVISFPRDLKLAIPSCPDGQGGNFPAMSEQMLNSAISYGGMQCVALTIAKLTGLDIPYAAKITFDGVIGVSNALGGVTVCLTEPIDDPYTGLVLPAGDNNLLGLDALQFLRTRHGVGNGSDVTRISNQQIFMSALVRELQSGDTFSDPLKVYSLAKAGIENMEMSSNMASISFLQSLAGTVKNLDLSRVNFVQYPSVAHPYEAGRLMPDYASGKLLMQVIESGKPFEVVGRGEAVVDPNAPTETPGTTTPTPGTQTPGTTPETPTNQVDDDGFTTNPDGVVLLPENITGQSAGNATCSAGRTRY